MVVDVNALTPDSQVITLLCTTLALPRGTKALTPTEWASLATTIHRSEIRRPGELLGRSAADIEGALGLSGAAASTVETLLRRGGQLAFELERLSGRGIWLVTRADDLYPERLKERLKATAPPVLFGCGRQEHLRRHGVAVVGSRDADEASTDFATALGRRLASDDTALISGAARGVDTTAMLAAADSGGIAIGLVADALEKVVRRQDLRAYIADGAITLLSAYHPEARFTVGNAMRRNRLIYCLSELAVVVASGDQGGTWQGALENLKAGWVPLFVRNGSAAPPANLNLIRAGGQALSRGDLDEARLLERLMDRRPSKQLKVSLDEAQEPPSPPLAVSGATKETGAGGGAFDDQNNQPPRPSTDVDAFALVWPALEAFLCEPHTEREVADHLGLELSQSRAWLKRACDEGQLERLDRPRRYRLGGRRAQLFNND
jgi:DNA processing protein